MTCIIKQMTYHHLMSAIYRGKIYVHIQNCTNITLRPMGNLQVNFIHFFEKEIFDIPREQVVKMFIKAMGV